MHHVYLLQRRVLWELDVPEVCILVITAQGSLLLGGWLKLVNSVCLLKVGEVRTRRYIMSQHLKLGDRSRSRRSRKQDLKFPSCDSSPGSLGLLGQSRRKER